MSDRSSDGSLHAEQNPASYGQAAAVAGGDSESLPDMVGTVLAGRYRILAKLGEGAMGEVYLGEHLKIGRRDAIKVLRGPLMRDSEAVARFNRGARNVAAVQHPNVCTIYDYSDTDGGIPFIAMEFVAGESLKDLLDREGPLPVERAARIARQVADALYAAHSAGVVHRDLKPANIMLMCGRGGADEVRVVDFDIAKGSQDGEEAEVTRLGFVIGTPEYMSPEQLMAERLDGRSDVYSLGIVLFRMLTGALPFQGGSPHELVFQRLTNPPLRLEQVLPGVDFPPRLQAVFDRALQRTPADRYPSAAEFARELAEAVAGGEGVPRLGEVHLSATGIIPAQAPPGRRASDGVPETRASGAVVADTVVSPAAARPGPERRGRAVLVGGAAAALLFAAGVGWFALGRSAESETVAVSPPPTGQEQSGDPGPAMPVGEARLFVSGATDSQTNEPEATTPAAQPAPPSRGTQPQLPAAQREIDLVIGSPPTPPPPAAPRAGIENPIEVLRRQIDRVSLGLSSGELLAQRDTARLLWEHEGLNVQQRSRAAWVAAGASNNLGNVAECRLWADRSLKLLENRAARDLFGRCGGY